jgi:tRNA1Val (adenine37-N6)-methyltransferase
MPNNYFQFKQFIIYQDNCAMKVTTDSCLFGAYIAEVIQNPKLKIKNCLDIGAGTGLLSLMLAQKTNTFIDAVEIDEPSYLQSKSNFEQSLWKERLNIFHADITQFDPGKKYDCIISNPPFFEDDLKSIHLNKNKAKHDVSLTLQQLVNAIDKNLNDDGVFFVLLPYHRTDYFLKEAAGLKFYPLEKVVIKQTPKHDFFRSILAFSRKETLLKTTELIIKDADEKYSENFTALLKDYYLQLV